MRLHVPIAFALLSAASLARAEVSLNVIGKVTVEEGTDAATVSISGSKPPNFTTMWMVDPPRFIIDLSESTFEGVPAELSGKGLVSSVQALSYGKDASAIARVVITYGKEINPPDVQTVGGTLVVKAKLPGAAAVAEAPADDAKAKARADEEARAREAKARADAASKTKAEASAKADAEAQARAEAKASAETKAKADREEKARADAEAREKADAEARAKAEAKARADEEARAKADDETKGKAEAQAREEERRKEETRDAAAREREAAEHARAEEQAKADEERRTRALAEASPPSERRDQEVAPPAPEPAPTAEPLQANSRSERLEPAGKPHRLREVGFRQLPEVSRVFLRTSGTPEFTISEVGQDVVRVELANTRARRRNDRRLLDTSFFPSAVSAITPRHEGSSYVLEIKLRQRVSYQQKIEGDMLAIDFDRPPNLRTVAPPAARAMEPAPSTAPEESSPAPAPSP